MARSKLSPAPGQETLDLIFTDGRPPEEASPEGNDRHGEYSSDDPRNQVTVVLRETLPEELSTGRVRVRETLEIQFPPNHRPSDGSVFFGHFDPERFKDAYSRLITAYRIALQEAELDPDDQTKKHVAEKTQETVSAYLRHASKTVGAKIVKALVASLNKPKQP